MELDESIAAWIPEEFEDGCRLRLVGDAMSGFHNFEPCASMNGLCSLATIEHSV